MRHRLTSGSTARILVLFLLAPGGGSSTASEQVTDWSSAMSLAEERLEQRRYQEGEDLLRAALALAGSEREIATTRLRLARFLSERPSSAATVEALELFRESLPDLPAGSKALAHNDYGVLLMQRGDERGALRVLTDGRAFLDVYAEEPQKQAVYLYNLATALEANGRSHDAFAAELDVLELDANFVLAQEAAIRLAERASDPHVGAARFQALATRLARRGALQTAESVLDYRMTEWNGRATAGASEGLLLTLLEYFAAAGTSPEDYAEKWASLLSSLADEEPHRARVGWIERVLRSKLTLTVDPHSVAAWAGMWTDTPEVMETLSRFVKSAGDYYYGHGDPSMAVERYTLSWRLGDNAEAAIHIAAVLLDSPSAVDPTGVWVQRLRRELSDYEIEDAQQSRRLTVPLAQSYAREGKYGAAEQLWEDALAVAQASRETIPDSRSAEPWLLEQLASAEIGLGRYWDARIHLERAGRLYDRLDQGEAARVARARAEDLISDPRPGYLPLGPGDSPGRSPATVRIAASPGGGATTGRIEGAVEDDEGARLPGVTVTAASPALQGERRQETDADGKFRFLGLPPGEYTLSASFEAFTPLEQTGIPVGLDRTVSLALSMSAGFAEEILVTGAAPMIDTTSTAAGASFSEELLRELPTTRTFPGVAFAAPGVVSAGLGENPSIGGASAAANRYLIDGLDTTDPALGTFGTQVPFEFVKEVEIKTGGYEAQFGGATGGVLNVVTKSGGNELRGDVFGYYTDDSWQSDVAQTAVLGRDLGSTEYDYGATLGGKIVKDRLWYFAAAAAGREEDDYATRESNRSVTKKTDRVYYAGKLTWLVSPSNQLVVFAFGDPTEVEDAAVRNAYGHLASGDEFGADTFGLTYNGTLSSSLFLELSASRYEEQVTSIPLGDVARYEQRGFNAAANPGKAYTDTDPCGDSSGFDSPYSYTIEPSCAGTDRVRPDNNRSRDELRGALNWFVSTGPLDHDVRLGGTARQVEYTDDSRYPGPFRQPLVDETGLVVDPTGLEGQRWLLFDGFAQLLEHRRSFAGETHEHGIYLQDRVRLNDYVRLNVGVRADAFESKGGGIDPLTGRFVDRGEAFPDRRLDFGLGDAVAPRVGFVWDVARNGRSKLHGHYGRFYESIPLELSARVFGTQILNLHSFHHPADGSVPTASNPGTWISSHPLGVDVAVSPELKPMYTEEYQIGGEYEVLPNLAVSLRYIHRAIDDAVEDVSVDGGRTYFVTNPGGTITVNPVTGEPLDGSAVFPEPSREYQAVELTLSKRFTGNWQLYASAVWSENEGNYGGFFRQDEPPIDPNVSSLYDLPDLLVGSSGPLPNDREYQVKAYGSYLWPFKLITGFYAQYLDGTPISQLGAHPIYGSGTRYVTPRGTFGRTPDVWNVDLHFDYPISLGNSLELNLIADVFNVTDQKEPTTVDPIWTFEPRFRTEDATECGGPGTGAGTSCPAGNPNFNAPLSFQQPLTVRLGVKLTW